MAPYPLKLINKCINFGGPGFLHGLPFSASKKLNNNKKIKNMKATLLMILLGFILPQINSNKSTIKDNLQIEKEITEFVKKEIIYDCDGVKIVKLETVDGLIIYNVIASIATVLLPDVVKAICNATVKDKVACDVAYEATSALVSLRGGRIFRGLTRGIHWIANRGSSRSTLKINANTYGLASNIKDALETYKTLGCVKWRRVDYDKSSTSVKNLSIKRDSRMPLALKDVPSCYHNGSHTLKLINMTTANMKLKIRNGNEGWRYKNLNSGYSTTLRSSSSKYWEIKINDVGNGKSFYKKIKCDSDDARCFQWNSSLNNFVAYVCEWNQ